MSRPPPQQRYSCSLRGQCEPNSRGDYTSLAQCQSQCQGSDNVDLLYLILSYDWEKALHSAPSDQQELLRREFGLRVSLDEVGEVIDNLAHNDLRALLLYSPSFVDYVEDYIESQPDSFEVFLLEVADQVSDYTYIDWSAYVEKARWMLGREMEVARGNPSIVYMLANTLLYDVLEDNGLTSRSGVIALVRGWMPELERLLLEE